MQRQYIQMDIIQKYNKFFSFMSVAILVLVAGLRSGIGDTPTYIQGYKTDAPSTIAGSIKLLFSGKRMQDSIFIREY